MVRSGSHFSVHPSTQTHTSHWKGFNFCLCSHERLIYCARDSIRTYCIQIHTAQNAHFLTEQNIA